MGRAPSVQGSEWVWPSNGRGSNLHHPAPSNLAVHDLFPTVRFHVRVLLKNSFAKFENSALRDEQSRKNKVLMASLSEILGVFLKKSRSLRSSQRPALKYIPRAFFIWRTINLCD